MSLPDQSRKPAYKMFADRKSSAQTPRLLLMLGYLDPSSVSMALSAVVGGIAGIAVFGKTLWAKMTSPLRKSSGVDTTDDILNSDATIDADLEID